MPKCLERVEPTAKKKKAKKGGEKNTTTEFTRKLMFY